ncbi:MAG TPA: PEP-CTERM sorting domain-containing protein [Gemmatimonadales bacterium]|jgi:hypothetical protein|nr:PEP-CTERM sorting domain-containing protein [Gemmatimonadales bacterium]
MPMTWTQSFSASEAMNINWQIRAAVYTSDLSPVGDYNSLFVVVTDAQGGHAGEPGADVYCNNALVGGATGGGGSNCTGSNSGTVSVTVPTSATPEPAGMALVGTGLVGVIGAGFIRRRRR